MISKSQRIILVVCVVFILSSMLDGIEGAVQTACFSGEKLCVTTCYNPDFQQCFGEGNNYRGIVCSKSEAVCGDPLSKYSDLECYNPTTQYCPPFNTSARACFKGQKLCESQIAADCYNPSTHICLQRKNNSFPAVCSPGQSACDDYPYCYDQNLEQCVMHANLSYPCFKGQLACEFYGCYNVGSKVCLVEENPDRLKYSLCLVGQNVCSGTCYNPASRVCIREGYKGVLCQIGQKLCGGECQDPSAKECKEN